MFKKVVTYSMLAVACMSAYSKDVDLKILVGYPPGGGSDVVARAFSTAASRQGYTVVVENKPGAGGFIGLAECVNRTATESNLLCIVNQGQVSYTPPGMEELIKYKQEDLNYVRLIASTPMVLVTSAKNTKGYTDFKNELSDKKLTTFGTPAPAATAFIGNLLKFFKNDSAVAEYKGAGPLINDVIGGHVQYALVPYAAAIGQHQGGLLRVIAACGPKSTLPVLQDIPLMDTKDGWSHDNSSDFGFVMGPNANKDAVRDNEQLVARIMGEAKVREDLSAMGIGLSTRSDSASFKKFVDSERKRFKQVLSK